MGLTIHYNFKFKGTKEEARNKLLQVKTIAEKLPFKEVGDLWDLDYSKSFNDEEENKKCAKGKEGDYRWAKIQYEPRDIDSSRIKISDGKFEGLVLMLWAGNGCESTNIGLVSKDGFNWSGGAFTKAQYAEEFIKCHLLVVKILDVCQSLGILEEVSDEGDYWETRDLKVLGDNITESSLFIEIIGGMIKGLGFDKIESAIDKSKNIVKVVNTKNRIKNK